MPRTTKTLTDTACKNAKPEAGAVKLFDGGGLYLEVRPTGSKLWRLKYRFASKDRYLALGAYPGVSLTEARRKREAARRMVSEGVDPIEQRQADAAAADSSFETIAREWFGKWSQTKAPSHSAKVMRRLERDVFPYIGAKPIGGIKAPALLAVLQRIEGRGVLETAHRAQQNIGQVMRYAIVTGRAESDPVASLRGALPAVSKQHYPAPTEPEAVGELLRAISAAKVGPVVDAALRLAPLVFARPGELRMMKWADVDLDAARWCYFVTKTKTDHVVPLSIQALTIIQDLQPLTGKGVYVFPSIRGRDKPLSDAALNAALRRLGIAKDQFTLHGWRAVARTLLHERLNWRPEVIEHQLAHKVPDALGNAYNRTRFMDDRVRMMQAWADYLDALRDQRKVIAGNFGRRA